MGDLRPSISSFLSSTTRKLLLLHLPITSTQPKSITMPRNGDGSSDNGPIDATQNVARADKTAPLPEGEKGQGLSDMPASGGSSQGIKRATTWDRARLAKFV